MDYKLCSAQYFAQYKKLSNRINELKQLLKTAKSREHKDLKSRISMLYSMCLELKHTAEYLKVCERRKTNDNQITYLFDNS
jgi:hypothetical protein